jgi:hypothetical protein
MNTKQQKQKQRQALAYYNWDDLRELGVTYHSNHLRTMWTKGLFPRPFHLSPRKLAWRQREVDHWLATRRRMRA